MTDRVPPQNLDAERAILGGVLLKPAAFPEVALEIQEGDFYLPAHREIWSAMRALDERRIPIDVVSLGDELRGRGVLQRLEGQDQYLVQMAAATPTAENIRHYCLNVRQKAVFRGAIELGAQLQRLAWAGEGDPLDLLERLQTDVMALTNRRTETLLPIQELLNEVEDRIEQAGKPDGPRFGVKTGFWQWDDLTDGLLVEQLILLAARTSVGKTTMAANIVRNCTADGTVDGLVFSLEQSRYEFVAKWISDLGEIDSRALRRGQLYAAEWGRIHEAVKRLRRSRIFIDDAGGDENTIGRIRSKMRRWRARYPDRMGIAVIDYLQLVDADGQHDNRVAAVGAVSRGLKALAKEVSVPVLALAQVGREVDKEKRPPRLADLKESGSLEQDADQVLFLHADGTPAEVAKRGVIDAILAKNRGGPTGGFQLGWHAKFGRFTNAEDRPPEQAELGV